MTKTPPEDKAKVPTTAASKSGGGISVYCGLILDLKFSFFRLSLPAVSSVSALIRKEKPCVGEKKEK